MNEEHTCEGKECCGAEAQNGCACHHGRHGWKRPAFAIAAIAGALFLLALTVTEVKGWKFVGADVAPQAVISVTGDADVYHAPDVAIVSFSISQDAKTAVEARKVVDDKMAAIMTALEKSKVEKKDIKTTSYDLSPKYEWQTMQVRCLAYPCPAPGGKQVLVGYTVTQSVDVKVRDIDAVGTVLGGLTDNGATNLSGPQYTIDDLDAVRNEARAQAISEAKAKAETLAKDLGVSLVRIVSYSDDGATMPIYNFARDAKMEVSAAGIAAPSVPVLPAGENKITANVMITYEIR